MSSRSPVPLSESVYANSEEYAELGGYSQHHTGSPLVAWTLLLAPSPREVTGIRTRGSLMVRGRASNACGCILRVGAESATEVRH